LFYGIILQTIKHQFPEIAMQRLFYFILLLIFPFVVEPKAPQLTSHDVKTKMEEILRAHVTYKKMTPELVERLLKNFINELDPTKSYFLESEIELWQHPTESLLQTVVDGFNRGDFSTFEEIYATFEQSINRRNAIEAEIEKQVLPTGVKGEEFKDIVFAKTREELAMRCLRVKALQAEIAEKLNDETRDIFSQRLQKRRLNREQELLSPSEEKQKMILSFVMKSATEALDAHTNYFTPSEASQFMIQVQQRLFGIGAQLKDNLDGFSVMRILENSPASLSNKLKINDKIIAVNHEPIVGLDIAEAVDLIRGEKGTAVTLTILRENSESHQVEKLEIELIRNEVVLEESRLETTVEPFGDGVIAHLKLFSFYQDPKSSSGSDIRKAVENIKKDHKLEGVILDLRSNAGGLLPQAVAVTGLFINKGIVVSIKDSSGKIQHLREVDGHPVFDGPLVVLVNRASASAAEIVTQTLQDYGRAIVVGDDHTFGKGTFQTFTLDPINNPKVNPQGEYKVTRGRYYTVSGKSPQLVGVHSDIVVPGLLSYLDIGEKFEKYPLANDEIEPHFDDDLADVSPLHRLQLGPMYRYNLQTKLTTYVSYMEMLKANSTARIEGNKNYQNFLRDLKNKNFDSQPVDFFGHDLQQIEAYNIIKDLIFLMNFQSQNVKIAS
jgi:carboxyl-terminal processing protease